MNINIGLKKDSCNSYCEHLSLNLENTDRTTYINKNQLAQAVSLLIST